MSMRKRKKVQILSREELMLRRWDFRLVPSERSLEAVGESVRLHIISRSKVFDLFPRTYKGKNRCVSRRKHALINSRERPLKSDINLEQSSHVETVALLSRETNPLTVEVRMEVETGEVKEHPTYKRIQEYVQEKYGFKVHTAYIAEVKRMVGLDMHKAPNAVEQRKHEYHPCPPEKVEAIKDALRHFGLISE